MPYTNFEDRRAYMRDYRAKNRDRQREWHRQWQANNPGRLQAYRKAYHAKRLSDDLAGVRAEQRAAWLAHRYGLTPGEYAEMVATQKNRCAICGDEPVDGQALHIDHDHESGIVRGLLCGHCNRAIGLFRDNPDVLETAAAYLRHFEVRDDVRD